jgi:peptidoglycan-associated lipoprotein
MPNRSTRKMILIFCALSLAVFAGACKRDTAPPRPTTPIAAAPPPPRPTVTLRAEKTFIQRGESTTLSWSSTNATDLTLSPGIGTVSPEGSTTVSPSDSTTYTITAKGPGGSNDSTVRITVSAAAPSAPAETRSATMEELFAQNVKDAFFDYDKADIRADARAALAQTAQFLRAYPQLRVTIEGHCDERGSTEYNLALGDRRAQAVRQFLISLGISADRLETVSWGKERPFCTQANESCWQQNRRGHFVMAR